MSEKTSRSLLILEAIIIALPLSGLAILVSIRLIFDVFQFPRLLYVVALGILAFISLSAVVSAWRLFIIFLRKGSDELKSQHVGWGVVILAGVLVLVGSLVSNLLPPSPEYSVWGTFRFNFDLFVYGAPMLLPLYHLAFERFLRKSDPLRFSPSVES